jgi:hypothetical protein
LPLEITRRRQIAERMAARPLPIPDVPLPRRRAAEPTVDDQAHHAENRDPGHPADRDIVEAVRHPDAARHGGGEYREDQGVGRAILMLDTRAAERPHAMLIAAQGIGADRIHCALPTVLSDSCHQLKQSGALATSDLSEQSILPFNIACQVDEGIPRRILDSTPTTSPPQAPVDANPLHRQAARHPTH